MSTCVVSHAQSSIADRPKMKCIRVLLVEDRFLVRQGLRRYLSHHVGIVTAGEAQNGEEAVKLADLLKPDVVVMDVSVLRKNSEGTGSLSRTHPHLPIVGLPLFVGKWNRETSLDDGACQSLEKLTASTHLPQAIYQAVDNNPHADLPSHRRVA